MPELVPIEYDPFKGTSTPQDFAKRYGGAADKAAKELGVDPSVILGQWGLETGWGKSIVPGTNNLGNIKDFAGTGVEATDNMTGSKDKYRAYESPDAFATDYVSLVQRKYPGAVGAKTPDDFAKALKAGGYAEDPRYVDKVVQASRMAGTKPSVLATAGKAVTDAIVPSAQAAEPTLVPVDFDPFAKQAKKQSPGIITSVGAGLGKGTGTVALGAQRYIGKGLSALGADEVGGWLQRDAEQGQAKLEAENQPYKQANPTSNALGEVGGNVLATLPVGGALGGVAKAAGAPALGNALASGGMTLGKTGGNALVNMGTRMAGGAITGGASAALVDPEASTTGAVIGGVLPPLVSGAGALGNALARTMRGPGAAPGVAEAAQAARAAGYVIPPTQVDPTLSNRLLEGFSGKLTTAQNASFKNQEVTNALAKNAIGADALTPEGLKAVRSQANAAYDALGQFGSVQTDDAFKAAMQKIGATSKQLKADFPELVNKDVDALVSGFAGKEQFDAQSAIEAMKRLRASGSANKANFSDPEKKALGQAQMKMASALEDLVDRNLANSGQQDLLRAFRAARQTLAKTYDVEKAMNPASGNIDANKLAQALKKGRPLSGDLETIANFSSTFPKATQTVERMGSLPQTSPLDWAAAGIGTAASGNPLAMAGVIARPMARNLSLSNAFQNRLVQSRTAAPQLQLTPEIRNALLQGVYRGAPVAGAER